MAVFTELSLFSGVGGGLLATRNLLGWRTVCYVEWDKYAVEVLKARIRDGYLDDAPIWDDAFTFDGRPWAGLVDVVTAGFPCQPFSVAGKGLAEHDPRNGWPAVVRILREVRPRYALLENVPGLLSKQYIRTIFGELAEAGYDARWDCISAEEIGANHKRERLWIVAHAIEWAEHVAEQPREKGLHAAGDGAASEVSDTDRTASARQREHGGEVYARAETERFDVGGGTFLHANSERRKEFKPSRVACDAGLGGGNGDEISDAAIHELGEHGESSAAAKPGKRRPDNGGREAQDVRGEWWAVEPRLGRVADGVAHRVDRLRAIGNGQVPDVVVEAYRRLMVGLVP